MRSIASIRTTLRPARLADLDEGRSKSLPVWGHKAEALVGDTIYLGHNHDICSFILSTWAKAEPEVCKVAVTSPIGQALLGKHQGDTIHLKTIEGEADYTILKIV